ncbi:MAG TPA: cytochrome c-type biogenesis protein CcmH, partial [Cellvibrionaceae bacterium]|nr:cytochrome c-type biogenesis protein CcmH [Cellvibrionaceae bacterium]
NSMIAMDLKREIHSMVEEGKSNQQIADFMVARYGDFVLYRPRMTTQTALLWGAPVGLFLVALIVVISLVRGRARALKVEPGTALSPEEQAQLLRLTGAASSAQSNHSKPHQG